MPQYGQLVTQRTHLKQQVATRRQCQPDRLERPNEVTHPA
jgi:hypothetical protein